jgi:hypothetical protein
MLYPIKKAGGSHVNPAYGLITNQPSSFNNHYVSGAGVGAQSIANRRIKQRLAAKPCKGYCFNGKYF